MFDKEYRPTLAQLRTFVTIAENKHFGTSAQKLRISQPSLSQALVALEQGLEIQLIERSTRKVIVTSAGERLLPFAKATLEAADIFMTHARGAHGELSGPLTIGMIPTVAPYVLPQILTEIQTQFPELEPRIVEEQTKHLTQKLRDGQLDMAIIALPAEGAGLVSVPLYRERFAVVLPDGHPLAGREDVTLAEIKDLELLLLDDGHCLRDQIMDLCRRADVNPSDATNSITRASSLTTIIQLVLGGLGSTLLPESAISTEYSNDKLKLATFADDVIAEREIGLVFRASAARGEEFRHFGDLVVQAYEAAIARSREVLASKTK
ncbi:LysR substrate-binding domain-containing protein [Corynebacterium sp. L4756]|uniref:hydrogen peroxide-inducible genes activator n=1 Tax=unclassified Corynebacterium TaxID=2624378 RepID=UPI00374DAFAC